MEEVTLRELFMTLVKHPIKLEEYDQRMMHIRKDLDKLSWFSRMNPDAYMTLLD